MIDKKTSKQSSEIALKSFFLGPRAENSPLVKKLVDFIFTHWFEWRKKNYPNDGVAITEKDQIAPEFQQKTEEMKLHLIDLLSRLQKEVPSFSPRYVGHMVSEISVPALLGHIVTLLHNPNNITGEVARVSIDIEREAICDLMVMLGYDPENGRGHFTSGGTVANFEGLIRARSRLAKWMAAGIFTENISRSKKSILEYAHQGWDRFENLTKYIATDELKQCHFLHYSPVEVAKKIDRIFNIDYKGPVVLAPQSKHYSWPKGIIMLGLGAESFWPIELDKYGMLSISDLKKKTELALKENRPVLSIVSVAGTTELGDFDPIHEVADYIENLEKSQDLHIWHHVDGAYGGFFRTLAKHKNSPIKEHTFNAIDAIPRSNSITVDPHKLGYVPYASGAFVCKDFKEYYVAPFDAPYLRFDYNSNKMPQTLEGSRSAGGAIACWLTSKCVGFNSSGYGTILEKTIKQRQELEVLLKASHINIRIAPHSQTNILCFCIAEDGEEISKTNAATEKVYEAFSQESVPFYVSMTSLKWDLYKEFLDDYVKDWDAKVDASELTLIRMTLMNPFFDSKDTKVNYQDEFIRELLKAI
ncbi:MAG: pyridoxal-dependent decarboxylase [bacterium]|nr:pyridoxal-dependent decarboxylase [bacterium]